MFNENDQGNDHVLKSPHGPCYAPRVRLSRYLAWALVLLLLVTVSLSCKTFDPELRDVSELGIPEAYTLYDESALGPDRWWESFQSAELDGLVEISLREENRRLKAILSTFNVKSRRVIRFQRSA